MTASISVCLPIVVGVIRSGVSSVSVDIPKTEPVSSLISVLAPLNISEEMSWVPVMSHNHVPNTVPSPVKMYPSVGILSCPRKFCAT